MKKNWEYDQNSSETLIESGLVIELDYRRSGNDEKEDQIKMKFQEQRYENHSSERGDAGEKKKVASCSHF